MPAPPFMDYVICPDGSTVIGDNCGTIVPLYKQEEIALANYRDNPIVQSAIEAERPIMTDNQLQAIAPLKKLIDTKTIVIVLGVALLAYYLINKKD